MFGELVFSSNRFIFWCVAPILVIVGLPLFVLPLITLVFVREDVLTLLLVSSMGFFCLMLTLGIYDSVRFNWAARIANAYVAVAITLVILTPFLEESPKSDEGYDLEWILIYVFGVVYLTYSFVYPCLYYARYGRFPKSIFSTESPFELTDEHIEELRILCPEEFDDDGNYIGEHFDLDVYHPYDYDENDNTIGRHDLGKFDSK